MVDIGIDVAPETFPSESRGGNADIICMSALLTTTMGKMKENIDLLKEKNVRDTNILLWLAAHR